MSDDVLVVLLLYSIPDSYKAFRCAIETRDELPQLETLKIKLIEEAQARKEKLCNTEQGALYTKEAKDQPKGESYRSSNQKYGNKYKCNYCHRMGHKAADCWKKNNDRRQNFA